MKQEVYMFERLDQTSSGENMSYLKCLVFVRPTRENIDLLVRELQRPRYGTYYICECRHHDIIVVIVICFFLHKK